MRSPKRARRGKKSAASLVFIAFVFAAACGGGEGGDEDGSTTLTVGVIPIADVAPLYLGIEQGFFEEENLRIETQFAEGGAAIVPSVVSRDFQVGFSNTTSLIIAVSQNVPVEIIAQGGTGGTGPDDAWDAVIVPGDSSIRAAEELGGKTIAVNTLNNVAELTADAALDQRGVDISTVNYTEIQFPDMLAALDAGDTDAAFVVEPFMTLGSASGNRVLMNPFEETAENLTVATYFSSSQYIEENSDVIERFQRAMNRSLEYAFDNPDEARAIVGTYTEIPPEVVDTMTLPVWGEDLNEPTIELMAELAVQYGFVQTQPSLDDLIH